MGADRQPLVAIGGFVVAHRRTAQIHRREIRRQDQRLPELGGFIGALVASGPAASYLEQWGISPEAAIAWRLGLNAQRLMLPIRDGQGRCCGFSGRSLNGEEPKYRNSSADLLF
jgi:hypothetical protein